MPYGRVGGKVRFSFIKERSKELDRDYSPEGTVKEFIPNKKYLILGSIETHQNFLKLL
jgi:hypothetical protein